MYLHHWKLVWSLSPNSPCWWVMDPLVSHPFLNILNCSVWGWVHRWVEQGLYWVIYQVQCMTICPWLDPRMFLCIWTFQNKVWVYVDKQDTVIVPVSGQVNNLTDRDEFILSFNSLGAFCFVTWAWPLNKTAVLWFWVAESTIQSFSSSTDSSLMSLPMVKLNTLSETATFFLAGGGLVLQYRRPLSLFPHLWLPIVHFFHISPSMTLLP